MPIEYDQLGNVIQGSLDNSNLLGLPPMTKAAQDMVANMGQRVVPGVSPGAEKPIPPQPVVNVTDIQGRQPFDDMRVRILVPPKYITPLTSGGKNELLNLSGIIFPYLPQIRCEFKADYASANPMHSNFSVNFYQRSNVSTISISGKFTVENQDDAIVYIATMHLLRALTRMRSGGASSGDADSGAPPPVCRLYAHGDMMFNNVPVAITSFRMEMPDGVDYFTLTDDAYYGTTAVPMISTIAISCMPMYSRDEMQAFSVSKYLTAADFRNRGYM